MYVEIFIFASTMNTIFRYMKKILLLLSLAMVFSNCSSNGSTCCGSDGDCCKGGFLGLVADRYSVRKFDSAAVEQEKTDLILKAGQLAPTAVNAQPQKIYVVRTPEMMKALNEVSPCIYGAPQCFVICYDANVAAHKGENGSWGEVDATIVTTHMMLEAANLGIGTCLVGYFDPQALSRALNLPEDIVPVLMMPYGYAAEDCEPSPKHTDRKAIEETVSYL